MNISINVVVLALCLLNFGATPLKHSFGSCSATYLLTAVFLIFEGMLRVLSGTICPTPNLVMLLTKIVALTNCCAFKLLHVIMS